MTKLLALKIYLKNLLITIRYKYKYNIKILNMFFFNLMYNKYINKISIWLFVISKCSYTPIFNIN